jgi:hypothetical protein
MSEIKKFYSLNFILSDKFEKDSSYSISVSEHLGPAWEH